MQNKKILIIDDDPHMRFILDRIFSQAGAETFAAREGSEGLRLLYRHHPDLVILDVMMPGKSGFVICAQIRELSPVPIIMLTSLDNEDEAVRGLDAGAVDYITKPFSTKVLLARARAALRQAHPHPSAARPTTVYRDNYLTVNLAERRVRIEGETIHLTKTEYELLAVLVRNAGRVLTFERILERVWGTGYDNSPNYIHDYVSRLRRKLEPNAEAPRYLVSERGVGYRFQPQR